MFTFSQHNKHDTEKNKRNFKQHESLRSSYSYSKKKMQFSTKAMVLVAGLFAGSTYAACDYFDTCSSDMVYCGATDIYVVCCDNDECGMSLLYVSFLSRLV